MKTIDAIRCILFDIDPLHLDANQDAFRVLSELVKNYDNLVATITGIAFPVWAKHVAVDGNGDVYAFDHDPIIEEGKGCWGKAPQFFPYTYKMQWMDNVSLPDGVDWRGLKFSLIRQVPS